MTSPDQPASESDVPEQFRIRQAKRERLLAEGRQPYPVEVARTHTLRQVRDAHPDLPPDTATGEKVAVAGRVIFVRNTGKLCFASASLDRVLPRSSSTAAITRRSAPRERGSPWPIQRAVSSGSPWASWWSSPSQRPRAWSS